MLGATKVSEGGIAKEQWLYLKNQDHTLAGSERAFDFQ
jgi:hypothetical protein